MAERPPSPRRAFGIRGEALAARWYEAQGYDVVDRNWRVAAGEIDLVLRRGRELVFCEVKSRSSARFGDPAEAVTASKQRRLRSLATAYLAGMPSSTLMRPVSIRFDVACVRGTDVEVIEQAF